MRKKKTNPEHNLNARAEVKDDGAKLRTFIFHISMRDDKYYVSNYLRHQFTVFQCFPIPCSKEKQYLI